MVDLQQWFVVENEASDVAYHIDFYTVVFCDGIQRFGIYVLNISPFLHAKNLCTIGDAIHQRVRPQAWVCQAFLERLAGLLFDLP